MHYWHNTGSTQNYNDTTYWFTDSGHTTNAGAKPTSSDDVQIDSGDLTINSTNSCRNFVVSSGYSDTITSNATLTCYGDTFTLVSTMTLDINTNSTFGVDYNGTVSVTTAGITLYNFIFGANIATTICSLQDAIILTNGFNCRRGELITNDYAIVCKSLSLWYSIWYKTLTLGSSTIILTGTTGGADGSGVISIVEDRKSYTTITAGHTSTLIFTGASPNCYFGDKTWYDVTFASSSAGTKYVYGANTFHTITVTGSANKTDGIVFYGNQTADVYAFNGDSAINRLLVYSSDYGTARTLSGNGSSTTTFATTSSNIDLRDITAGTYASGETDLSAITGLSGDCGGNTGFTFTTGISCYWVHSSSTVDDWSGENTGGNRWFASDHTTGVRVPLPQDNIEIDSSSFAVNGKVIRLTMPRLGNNINFNGATKTFTTQMNLASPYDSRIYGNLICSSLQSWSVTYTFVFDGRTNTTVTMNGTNFAGAVALQKFGATITQTDAFRTNSAYFVNYGTWISNGYAITMVDNRTNLYGNGGITLGNSTITVTTNGGNYYGWLMTENDKTFTFDAGTSTIQFTGTNTTYDTFISGGYTYYNINLPDKTSGVRRLTFRVSGNIIINELNLGGLNTLKLISDYDTTVNSFNFTSTSGYISVLSSTSISAHNLICNSGTINAHYCTISYSNASGGATFDASDGTNTDGGNNTGWIWIPFYPHVIFM